MKHSAAETASVPKSEGTSQEKPSRWLRLRQWLGLISATSQGEASGAVSEGNGQGGNGTPSNATVATKEPSKAGRIFDAALVKYEEQTKNEAGRPEGRIFPEMDVGAQVYPNPRMWGPDTGGVPLTEDEHYGKVARMLDRIDREDGFDGRTAP
ncbi:MAG TPA: hypothetical protein VFH99_03130 [Candidatus Saccharimonadales bacterium]|nr:hypothetical protein [Candidatus Saccharimonadales bacterium]